MIVRILVTVATIVGLASSTALAQATNPLVGTWKLNVAKSGNAFKSGLTKIEAAGDGVKFTVDMVAADGTARHWTFTGKFDGKDYPVVGNSPYGDMTAMTRVDANTTQLVSKKGGKETVRQTIVVSADGKTRTTTTKGTNAMGQPVDTVAIYEKQ
jgi:hypothetical protein